MPLVGRCADDMCTGETKPLYECHCCIRFICLPHLIQHDEKATLNKQRLQTCIVQMTSVLSTLEMIIEEKMRIIEQHKTLLETAKSALTTSSSADDIQIILDQVHMIIEANQKNEVVVKVESSLVENYPVVAKNDSCQYSSDVSMFLHNEPASENGENEFLVESILCNARQESRSSSLDESNCSVYNTYVSEKPTTMETINHNSMDIDDSSTRMCLFQRPVDNTKAKASDDRHLDNLDAAIKPISSSSIINYCGLCPLTFDGAFGLTKAKHLIRLCNSQAARRQVLYSHFIHIHSMGAIYAKRLVKAILHGQDPNTTKLFRDDEDIVNKTSKFVCPFYGRTTNPFPCHPKKIPNTPCYFHPTSSECFTSHLIISHHLTNSAIKTIIKGYKSDSKIIVFDKDESIVKKDYFEG
ncbi:unnamed protein product [Rotaria magnacalcarata]|uniref:Uncharacterized protein n=1 Tax=Rotaria magnacalcarata TaxID=392030 RepID=A0A819NI88_9BILA|nr:unnamed protein product [Rotaria magnacalcarata]